MSRTTTRLTPEHLDALAAEGSPCRACTFWELDPVRRSRCGTAAARAGRKRAWLEDVLAQWGSCGRVALVDDRPVGYVVYAPPAFVPGAAGFPTAPVSPDAVLLTTVHVAADHAGGGLARVLVQAMARDLVEREVVAVEAFGSTGGPLAPRSCVLPVDLLRAVGFTAHRPHATTPRLRMDLRTALTWKDEVGSVLGRLRSLGTARPAPVAVPDARTPRT